ncbi:RICIN domain-containing protein [Streptomyces africanus]|uniref:RICIN domain-containing protein n=1 Tax=Streptomyces africanus TaxID=231024 RepID=UPI0027D8A447|nr:RICIN domain-containing protein [Streptomyces africanus]
MEIPGGSTADGATADQWTCDGGTHQLWRKTAAIGGYVTFTNVNSGLCLQVAGASTTNGAALSQSSCNGGVNQQWLVVGRSGRDVFTAAAERAGRRAPQTRSPRCGTARCH